MVPEHLRTPYNRTSMKPFSPMTHLYIVIPRAIITIKTFIIILILDIHSSEFLPANFHKDFVGEICLDEPTEKDMSMSNMEKSGEMVRW